MQNDTTNDVAAQGPIISVRFCRDATGRMPAAEFLDNEAPAKDARRLRHWFLVMASQGQILGHEDAFVFERAPFYAFKSWQSRIPCFRDGNTWWLTHGFIKKKDKWPEGEFTRAENMRAIHLARKGRG